MLSFNGFVNEQMLNEGFVNLFLSDREKRKEWADAVWNMLQESYKDIGGIKGSGFGSKEEMIAKIPFWKIATVKGRPVAVIMYKDKGGRKSVASATERVNGRASPDGKKRLLEMLKADFSRSWGERSKNLLRFVEKNMPELLKQYAIPAEKVKELLGKKWDTGGYSFIKGEKYMFMHKLGSDNEPKMAMGTPGKHIVDYPKGY